MENVFSYYQLVLNYALVITVCRIGEIMYKKDQGVSELRNNS